MAEKLNIVTYNVRGLNNSTKRREIFYYLHKKDYDVMLLQETHGCVNSKKCGQMNLAQQFGSATVKKRKGCGNFI